jgi:glycerol-3-phosphate acyltransferase PlsY
MLRKAEVYEMIWKYIVCMLVSYLLGCFQSAYILGKLFKKIDIRDYGSGNSGTTNALRVLGPWGGAAVLLLDMGKGVLAVYISILLFTRANMVMMLTAGLCCVLGHNYPFYMKFRGGKGIASSLGIFLMINPLAFGIAAIPSAIALVCSRTISIASLTFMFSIMLTMLVLYIGDPNLILIFLLTACYTMIAFVRHRANLKRIVDHKEPKLWGKGSKHDKAKTENKDGTH